MNHQHLASLGKGMFSAERASLVRNNSSSMSSQMAAINAAARNQVCFCLIISHSERKGVRSLLVRRSFNSVGALKMEALCFSKTLVSTYKSTWCSNPEGQYQHLCCYENLKYIFFCFYQSLLAVGVWSFCHFHPLAA
jgi:hypothetical protein